MFYNGHVLQMVMCYNGHVLQQVLCNRHSTHTTIAPFERKEDQDKRKYNRCNTTENTNNAIQQTIETHNRQKCHYATRNMQHHNYAQGHPQLDTIGTWGCAVPGCSPPIRLSHRWCLIFTNTSKSLSSDTSLGCGIWSRYMLGSTINE